MGNLRTLVEIGKSDSDKPRPGNFPIICKKKLNDILNERPAKYFSI